MHSPVVLKISAHNSNTGTQRSSCPNGNAPEVAAVVSAMTDSYNHCRHVQRSLFPVGLLVTDQSFLSRPQAHHFLQSTLAPGGNLPFAIAGQALKSRGKLPPIRLSGAACQHLFEEHGLPPTLQAQNMAK